MIHLDKIEVKEASRVWGDFIEKIAFEFDVNGANVLGSIAGSFAGSRTYNHMKDKRNAKQLTAMENEQKLENDYYDNIQAILRDLKIVFTPINVVYSVNGQVFEIIKSGEMSPEMKDRFISKDGDYFKQLILNKMNMELQLAEQIFARKLLQPHLPEGFKEAHFLTALLEKLSSEDYDLKTPANFEKTAGENFIKINPTLDSLRPFSKSEGFFNKMEKVSNIVTPYGPSVVESFSAKDMKANVDVAFLPDRIVFLLDGNLVEQITVMQMNADGYEAFKKRDRDFFLDFFHEEARKISEAIFKDVMESKSPENIFDKEAAGDQEDGETNIFEKITDNNEDDDEEKSEEEDNVVDIEKEAASLEEVMASVNRAWIEELAIERDDFHLFYDHDAHPLVYDIILDKKIHDDWHTLELEAVLKEIELTFNLDEPINDRVIDKIATLHTIQNEEHSMFATSFSFEKFLRAMNSKTILITTFEGGIEFEELLLAIDIAKSVCGDSVFSEFGRNVAPYVSEELFRDNIRFVSDQVYDETNGPEKEFWDEVNDFLMRKWNERDARGVEPEEFSAIKQRTSKIVEIGELILSTYAEYTSFQRPYDSIREVLHAQSLLKGIDEAAGVEQAVVQTTSRHLIALIFLEVKRQEAVNTVSGLGEGESE